VDEFTVGLERALTRDVRLSVTGIWREDKNLQGSVLPSARWEAQTIDNELTGQPMSVYTWLNPDESEGDLLLTNPDGFQFLGANGEVLGAARAFRKYRGLMVVMDKRLNNRWLGRVSYVLSKAEGTVDNDGFDSYGVSTVYESASRALVNNEGLLPNDRRHEVKVMLGVQVPVVEVAVNAYFRGISGDRYTPFQQFGLSAVNFPLSTGRRVRLEPRGSRSVDPEKLLDLRLEKIFKIAGRKDRIALYADIANVTNSSRVRQVITRFPDQAIAGVDFDGDGAFDPVPFGAPSGLIAPRQIQLGARWSF
jgi:hypothetical protein